MAYGVLILEDEASLARNIKAYLEEEGFEAKVAGDGETGLRLFESFGPDIVLLDLQLPGMSGLAALREMRSRRPDVRVIMLTAHGSVQVAVEAIKAGAYEYLAKPVVLSELCRTIERALQNNAAATAPMTGYVRFRPEGDGAVFSGDFGDPEGHMEASGTYWLLPYWLGRYLNIIGPPQG